VSLLRYELGFYIPEDGILHAMGKIPRCLLHRRLMGLRIGVVDIRRRETVPRPGLKPQPIASCCNDYDIPSPL
jgi:hypothetical protein